MTVLRLLCVLVISLSIFGCSGNHNSISKNTEAAKLTNGYVGSSIHNAAVYIVPTDVQGQPASNDEGTGFDGSLAYSGQDGAYNGSVDKTNIGRATVFIAKANLVAKDASSAKENLTQQSCELVGGCASTPYRGRYKVADDFLLRAAVGNIQDAMRVNINWITHLATDIAYTSYSDSTDDNQNNPSTGKDGIFSPFTIERGNIWLNKQLGINDVVSVRPIPPTQMNAFAKLDANLREQGILYGALLAGGQKLAFARSDQSEKAWLEELVSQQRANLGQLYQNNSSGFSLCALYGAAYEALDANIKQSSLSSAVSTSAQNVLNSLAGKKGTYCQASLGSPTAIEVSKDEIKDWVSKFANAKIFVADLNERLMNLQCKATDSDLDGDGTVENFFACDYVSRTQKYYDDLEALYKANRAGLDGALVQIRDAVLDYSRCLNSQTPCGAGYSASNQSYQAGDLTLTWQVVNDSSTVVCNALNSEGKCSDKSYLAFDFIIKGKQTAGSLSIEHKGAENEKDKTKIDPSRVRLVYTSAYKTPPATALADSTDQVPSTGVEPLGFDFLFPELLVTGGADPYSSVRLYLAAKLIGVKPDFETSSKPYHYNFTELNAGINIEGNPLGSIQESGKTVELKNRAALILTSKYSDGANFYSKQLWPQKGDFFTSESGVTKQPIIAGLFKYSLKKSTCNQAAIDENCMLISYEKDKQGTVTAQTWQDSQYLELTVGSLGTNRYEVFSITNKDNKKQTVMRSCSVDLSLGDFRKREQAKICTSTTNAEDNFDLITNLIHAEDGLKTKSFALPAYGTYKPELTSVSWNSSGSWDGKQDGEFVQGIESSNLRITQEFVDGTGSGVKRAPLATLNIKANKKTAKRWEISLSAGLDYQYLVDILPTGKDVQSFYLSYYVNERQGTGANKDKTYATELGSLAVLRGGVTMFGAENGESIGLTMAGKVDYEQDSSSTTGCGYNAATGAKNCNEVGYLTFRGALVGVIREERAGVYVVRYSDGTFSVLGAQ